MTGAAKNTVTKLPVDLGTVCSIHQDRVMRVTFPASGFSVTRSGVRLCQAEERPRAQHWGSRGRVDMGCARHGYEARAHLSDRPPRPQHRHGADDRSSKPPSSSHPTHHGWPARLRQCRDRSFDGEIDYAQLIKIYGQDPQPPRRYSPAVCIGTDVQEISGNPNAEHISISYIERQNLTMRMSMRRFMRLTNAFSKKVENLAAAVSVHFFFHYNFVRVHKTLGTMPAVAAGVTDHVWTLDEMIGLLGEAERVPVKHGRYTKTRTVRRAAEISD